MRRVARLAGLVTVLGLLAAGCGVPRGEAEVGDCFETGSAAAFDWDAEVDCDNAHSVEVFAAVALTGRLATYPRGELAKEGTEARDRYLDLVTELCEPRWSAYTGYDTLAPQAPDAVVLPALYGDMAVEAVPADNWDAGDKRVVCYQVLGRPGDGGEQALLVEGRVLDGLAADPDEVPLDVRDCALSPTAEQGERKVACREQHDREYLGHLDLAEFAGITPGLDQAFLDRFDSAASPEQEWAVIDGLCGQVFGSLIGQRRPDITVLSQVFTADPDWGWADEGAYHAACFAQTAQLTGRSVVGIDTAPLR
ncbi:MAG: septum formation family protein [Pseudonocardia sp.]